MTGGRSVAGNANYARTPGARVGARYRQRQPVEVSKILLRSYGKGRRTPMDPTAFAGLMMRRLGGGPARTSSLIRKAVS
jgi:hypothetical protein